MSFFKFLFIIILLIVIYFEFVPFILLNTLLNGNAHIMTKAELLRHNLDIKLTEMKYNTFIKT